jgi:glycosyltransferase involved in cell wall biosynthesis
MMEAAAAGLKLIAPNHSAYLAYLDPSCAQLITSRAIPAVSHNEDELGILFEHALWWQPDEDEAITCIRSAIEGRDGNKASPRDRIVREFTWEKATHRLIAILGEAARHKRRGLWSLPRVYRHA